MVTAGILPFRENSHSRAGNRNRVPMISGQRLWPLDHGAGHVKRSKQASNSHVETIKYLINEDLFIYLQL